MKYPKTTRSMHGDKLPSYTSSPLSEYLGSRMYRLLGVDVHDTLLGFDKDKVVVACRDFRPENGILKEFRSIKNAMTPELNDLFEMNVSESTTGDRVNLEETLFHLEHNPVCDVPGIRERLCDMIAIDAIIDNNDRNNGNWGPISVGGAHALAPVFDNGSAFSNIVDDDHLDTDPRTMLEKWVGGRSIYELDGHQLSNKNLFAVDLPGLREAVERAVTAYRTNHDAIRALVMDLPESHDGKPVCSEMCEHAYLTGMDARVDWLAADFEIG